MEVLFGGFILRDMFLLMKPDLFVKFLSVNFGNVLNHNGNISGIKRSLKFCIISSVLKDNSFAKEIG